MPDIQELLAAKTYPKGLPDYLAEKAGEATDAVGRKLKRGLAQVAVSGFGKGALLTAGVLIAGAAIAFGFGAYAGEITTAGGTLATVEQGLLIGVSYAMRILTSGYGLIAMAIGGTLGAVSDTRKHQNKITAEVARAEAIEFARLRELQQVKEIEQTHQAEPSASFAARELERRAQPNRNLGIN
jgi:hypothetical protein